jgi:hypothetical protein
MYVYWLNSKPKSGVSFYSENAHASILQHYGEQAYRTHGKIKNAYSINNFGRETLTAYTTSET